MKIILGSVLAVTPYAPGMAWTPLQLAVGLRRLGHDVYFVEQVEPHWCTDAKGKPVPYEQSVNRDLFRSTVEQFDLMDRASQIYDDGKAVYGRPREAVV